MHATTHLLYPCDTSAASATLPTERASAGSVHARQAPRSAGEGNRGRQGEGGGGGKAAAFPTADERVGAEDERTHQDQEWPPSAGEISRCRGQGTADIGKKRLGVKFSIGAKACWGVCVGLHVDAYYTSSGWRLLAALLYKYAAACST